MSESQAELDNCRACDEEREYVEVPIFDMTHRPTNAHLVRHDGICAVCSERVFDPAKIRQVLDQINQGEL